MPALVPLRAASGSRYPSLPVALSENHTRPRRSMVRECGLEVSTGTGDSSGSSTSTLLGIR